jgi:acetoin utilization deacetylase AcuC-like enzyme
MVPVFYRPEQSSTAAVEFSPSAGKPKLVIEDWLLEPAIRQHIRIESFAPANDAVLCAAHEAAYVSGVLSGQKCNGFGNTSLAIAQSLRFTTGSMVAAAQHVLVATPTSTFRVAVSPTSGFHHAGVNFGGGFCTFNALMAAAIQVHSLGLARNILILDMDQHYGNGTADIIEKRGIDYVDHITAGKPFRTAAAALRCADLLLNSAFKGKRYDLVLYQAGADIHVDDPLGGLLDTKQMQLRDELVFRACASLDVPVVWNLAGGYQRDAKGAIEPVLALHRNTMIQCIKTMTSLRSDGQAGVKSPQANLKEQSASLLHGVQAA